jgi:hypothetical protein
MKIWQSGFDCWIDPSPRDMEAAVRSFQETGIAFNRYFVGYVQTIKLLMLAGF